MPSMDNSEFLPKENENTRESGPGTYVNKKFIHLEFTKKHDQQKQNTDEKDQDCNKGFMDKVSEPPELVSHSEEHLPKPQTVDDAIKCTSENVSSPTTNICDHQVEAIEEEIKDRPEALPSQEFLCSIIRVNENKTGCGKDQSQSIKPVHACPSPSKTRSPVPPENRSVNKIVDMFNRKESRLCNCGKFDQKVIRPCKSHETIRSKSYNVQCRMANQCKSAKENRDQKKKGSPNRQEVSTAEESSASSWKTIYLLSLTILFFIVTVVCLVR